MTKSRAVFYLDLKRRTSEVKVHTDTHEFVGGLGLGLKLLSDLKQANPVIFAIGPLNDSFPFVSKTCSLFYDQRGHLVETYGGGRLGLVLSLTSFDAVIITGRSPKPVFVAISSNNVEFLSDGSQLTSLGLPGRSSFVQFGQGLATIDTHFGFDVRLGERLSSANLMSLTVNADRSYRIDRPEEYPKLYQEILLRGRELSVAYGNKPSCAGCPAGCDQSSEPEFNSTLALPYCLVACGFAQEIFNDVPTVFSCLHALGLEYNHEILEEISLKIDKMRIEHAKI